MPARLRLIEDLDPGDPRPCLALDAWMGVHTRKKVGVQAHLARNKGGSFALIVQGQALVTFYEHCLELHLPPVPYLLKREPAGNPLETRAENGWTPQGAWNRVLADRFGTVLALWGAEIISGDGALYVLRAGQAERLTEGLRVPYKVETPAPRVGN